MYTFITNPNARSGLGKQLWNNLETILNEKGINYEVYFTKYQRHATDIVRDLTSDHEKHTIIALGGDGTLNEVINGITDLSKVTLGYIPTGSSNDFSRGMKLPTDPVKALENIITPSCYKTLNIGVLKYEDRTQRFIVSSGIGFDAGVCHQIMISPLKVILNQIKLGKLSYVAVALQLLLSMRPANMTITLDDTNTMTFDKVYFTTAMNLPYEGGGFKFCPKADCQDDKLDIIVVAGLPRLKVLALLPTAFKGWHTRFKGIHTYSCRKIDVVSDLALPVHTDGEPVLKQTHVQAYLEPEKLRVIATP
jgi:YegS/Rv2252/BmrU family lipid kinase